MKTRGGFTLFEILVSLAIGMIIFGAVVVSTSAFTRNRHLDSAVDTAVSYLRTAAMRSMQGEGNASHGVSFASGRITLFRGDSYVARDQAYDTVWERPDYVTAAGLQEIIFGKQTGTPSATGDIVFSNGRKAITVTVYPTGAISQP